MGWGIKIAIGLIALFGALVLAVYLYALHWHPSDTDHPVQGIDVSHHQDTIDWPKVAAMGEVDFAYIKATEGGDHVDRLFKTNWDGAAKVGIARGAYHFFTLCRSGKDQAANFVTTVPADPKALPPVVDLEYLGNCKERPKITDLHKEIADYLAVVEAHSGKPAMLYLTQEFDETYEVSAGVNRPLWLRSIVSKPSFGARAWAIWQVSQFRHIDGIKGRVDWNVASVDFANSEFANIDFAHPANPRTIP